MCLFGKKFKNIEQRLELLYMEVRDLEFRAESLEKGLDASHDKGSKYYDGVRSKVDMLESYLDLEGNKFSKWVSKRV